MIDSETSTENIGSSKKTRITMRRFRITPSSRSKIKRKVSSRLDAKNNKALQVAGLLDQEGGKWVVVTRGNDQAFGLADLLVSNATIFFQQLANQGVLITSQKLKSQVQSQVDDISAWPQAVYVARRAGHHRGAYVKPDGAIVGRPSVGDIRVMLEAPVGALARSGSLQGWQSAVRRYVTGQSIFTFALCLGFVGPILELCPLKENFGGELVGPSSTGKTTALDLCASVWGAPLDLRGSIAQKWRTTVDGLEAPMMARAGSILPLDESNLLGINDAKAASKLADCAFMLAEGVEKSRYNSPAAARVSLVFLSTSNAPLLDLLRSVPEDVISAVRVRLITIPVGKGLGAWDSLPADITSSGEATQALKAALTAHHGHAMDGYLHRLVRMMASDEQALRSRIISHVNTFLKLVGADATDGLSFRHAQRFAVVYAAGRLASNWGVLPIKRLKQPLLRAYQRSLARASALPFVTQTASQVVEAYVAQYRSSLTDLEVQPAPEMTVAELNAHTGFLKTLRGQRHLLVRRHRWEAQFGSESQRMLKELRVASRLYKTEGLQLQTRVRSNAAKDRVYAVALT